jgi:hypothetical protein
MRVANAISAAVVLILVPLVTIPSLVFAQDKADGKTGEVSAELKEQYAKFEKLMNGSNLVGKFTIVGRPQDGPLPEEYYGIESVRKLPEGDKWLIRARIKYGKTDVTVPLPLDVRFVDDTPMITLTKANIPLMGEFSVRKAPMPA